MQDPVVIMNFTHIYEDETFYISEQKSSTSRSCEASSTPLSGPANVRAASGAPSDRPASFVASDRPVSIAASSGPATARAASGAPSDRPVSIAAASSSPVTARAASGAPSDRPVSIAASSGPVTSRASSSKPYILDFTTLSGTTGFCDDAAADEIRRRIADFPARGIHFLDNGNFHYLTRFWCEKITEDFVLVVYDHHVDLRKPVFPGLMSCGSWIRDVLLRNSHCRAVLIIGPERAQADIIERELQSLADEDSFSDDSMSGTAAERRMTADQATHASAAGQPSHASAADYASHSWTYVRREASDQPPRSSTSVRRDTDGQRLCASAPVRVCCFTEDDILDGRVARELPHILDALHLPVYISIDKDVLSRKVLRTNWDQGIMTEAEFRRELDRFTMDPKIHILGVDICGEPAYNACRRLLDDTRDLRRSDGVNRRLLEHYLSRAH